MLLRGFSTFRTALLVCALALGAATTPARASVRGTQCAAEDKAKRSKDALDVALGLYTAATAMCGIACAQPQTTAFVGTSCTALTFGAMGYDIYQAISISKDPSGLMGLVFGLTAGGLKESTMSTYGLLTAPGTEAAAGPTEANMAAARQPARGSVPDDLNPDVQANADKAKDENSKGYCMTAVMNGVQAAMKAMAAKSAAGAEKAAKEECAAQPEGTTQLTLGQANGITGGAAETTVTALGNPAGERGAISAGGVSDCSPGIRRDLKTFENCATAADPSTSRFFTSDFKEDFKNVTGTDLGSFLNAQPAGGGLADRLSAGAAALGRKGPDTDEAAKEFEALINKELEKSGQGSLYSGGGGGNSRSAAKDPFDPKKLMKDMMAALTGNKGEAEKKRLADSLVFGATREPASDVAARRDISLFDRVGTRYRQTQERLGP